MIGRSEYLKIHDVIWRIHLKILSNIRIAEQEEIKIKTAKVISTLKLLCQ